MDIWLVMSRVYHEQKIVYWSPQIWNGGAVDLVMNIILHRFSSTESYHLKSNICKSDTNFHLNETQRNQIGT